MSNFEKLAFSFKGYTAVLDVAECKTKFVTPDGVMVSKSDLPAEVVDAYERQGEGTFYMGGVI